MSFKCCRGMPFGFYKAARKNWHIFYIHVVYEAALEIIFFEIKVNAYKKTYKINNKKAGGSRLLRRELEIRKISS